MNLYELFSGTSPRNHVNLRDESVYSATRRVKLAERPTATFEVVSEGWISGLQLPAYFLDSAAAGRHGRRTTGCKRLASRHYALTMQMNRHELTAFHNRFGVKLYY